MSYRNSDCKVYIGGLPSTATSEEIEDAFNRFGRIRKVWVARRPPGFAFVEFEDDRDAEDSVKALDGSRLCGMRVRVELSHGKRRNTGYGGGRGGGGGGYRGYRGGGGGYGGNYGGRRRSRSRSRTRSRSRSPVRDSRSRSPEYRKDKEDRVSRSRSRSHSRS